MQRLNLLTLAAFLLGLGVFIYDSATPRGTRFGTETVAWNIPVEAGPAISDLRLALD